MDFKKIPIAIFVFLIYIFLSLSNVSADSHLTVTERGASSDIFSTDEMGIAGELAGTPTPQPAPNIATSDKSHRSWLHQKDKSKSVPKKIAKKEKPEKKYPSIKVRYKVYVSNPTSRGNSKYSYKKFSSRGSGYRYEYIDITPIIIREAKKNGISPLLLKGVIATESGFNTYAVGSSGSLGLCQLMPQTARNMGVKDPFNPEQNIAGGAKLLGQLLRYYGSVDKALAAYNLGSGSVSRYGGVPSCAWGFISTVKSNMKW